MSIFDLLFLLCALSTIVTLITALVCAAIGQRRRALAILRPWGMAAAIYFAADLLSIWLRPVRVLHLRDPQCSDDWCFVVEGAGREAPDSNAYQVTLRIYSSAGRVEQRERGLSVYLTDPAGRRYDPVPQPSDLPLDTLLQPGESAVARRTFQVPPGVRPLKLSMVHEGGIPIGRLIIGRSPFDSRTVVRLN
jgi:hypothetical protein